MANSRKTKLPADDMLEGMLSKEEQLLEWIVEKRDAALSLALLAAGGLLVLLGAAFIMKNRGLKAQTLLGEALDNYHGTVSLGSAAATPPRAGEKRFASDTERLKATADRLRELTEKYPGSTAARDGRLLQVALFTEQGELEKAYQLAAGLSVSGDAETAGLGLSALATLAGKLGKEVTIDEKTKMSAERQALEKAIALNSPTFPVAAARLRLADFYLRQSPQQTELARAELKKVQDDKNAAEFQGKAGEVMKTLPPAPEVPGSAPASAAK